MQFYRKPEAVKRAFWWKTVHKIFRSYIKYTVSIWDGISLSSNFWKLKPCMDNFYLECNLPYLNFEGCIVYALSYLKCHLEVLIPREQNFIICFSLSIHLPRAPNSPKHAFATTRISLVFFLWIFYEEML